MTDTPVLSILRDRLAGWLGLTHGGMRDLYEQFGWPKVVLKEQLFAMYNRNGVANRIIKLYPQATWRDKPVIRDEEGANPTKGEPGYSPFAEAADKLFEDNRLYHILERGDRISTIGQFGCILLGFMGNRDMKEPLGKGNQKLLYAQPYSELNISINQIDDDPKSPRFGRPLTYTLQTGATASQGQASYRRSIVAHWTRVLHLAEVLDEDNVYGIPRLLSIFNYLQDLDKLLGSSVETYWLNARAGLALEADKDVQLSTTQIEAMRAQALEYEHKLRRIMALQGTHANMLNASSDDPSPTVNGLMDAISSGSGVPKRILMGSERGELASAQDENNWAQRIEERRQSYAVPAILTPLVTILIATGNLPQPKGQWWIEWAGKSMSPEQQASVGSSMAATLKNYLTAPGADILVPPTEFRSKFLGLTPHPEVSEDDDEINQSLRKLAEEEKADALEMEKAKADAKARGADGKDAAAEDESEGEEPKVNTKMSPLYVYRPVLNADQIADWARAQGIENIVPPEEMHVTVLYSKTPVDWLAMGYDHGSEDGKGQVTVRPGGPRIVEILGEDALVLSFAHNGLSYRHEELKRKGATSEYSSFCCHVTLSYGGLGDLDLLEIEPYQGEILLGPEKFEELQPNWKVELLEDA